MILENEQSVKQCYETYYVGRSEDRNDLLTNSEVSFQAFAFDYSIICALQSLKLNRYITKVLDVGCGSGHSMINFIRLGFPLGALRGVDILDHRIQEARQRFPQITFDIADATCLPYEDTAYDLLFESTMFLQITDDALASKIGKEMLRVTKTGGHIVLVDWRYGKPGNPDFNAVTKERIAKIFDVGSHCKIQSQHKGALIPPVGRFLSKYVPSVYFLVQRMFPFLVGQVTTVLQKTSN